MKFDLHDCWKHVNCMDVFFFIHTFYQDDGKTVWLVGNWMIQGVANHWMASPQETFYITEVEYDHWRRYDPNGMFV